MKLKTIFQLSGVCGVLCSLAACSGADTSGLDGDATGGSGDTGGAGGSANAGGGSGGEGLPAGAGGEAGTWSGDGNPLSTDCFAPIQQPGSLVSWEYDSAGIVVGTHCHGTDHQDIDTVNRVVFLGDSIMKGTPPTPESAFVRTLIANQLRDRFGVGDIVECSEWGARNDDLMQQRTDCFSASNMNQPTLTIIIMGGNDIAKIAKDKPSVADSVVIVDQDLAELRDTIEWLTDPTNFPNGNYVVFANVYEYTDTSADLSSCILAATQGLSGKWLSGARVITYMNEGYAQIAADTGTDMVFLMEAFCGHGFKLADPTLQCYRGPGAEMWFDGTCIHPNPAGHGIIAELFMDVIEE